MKSHDPEPLIHLLRDHLAAHDKRLVFLFGAGTSSAVNVAPDPPIGELRAYKPLVPAVDLLTSECQTAVESISKAHGAAWTKLVDECKVLSQATNIESVLGRLQLKSEAAGPGDLALGLDLPQLEEFEKTIRATIARLASPLEEVIPASLPHDEFARWIKRVHRRHPVEVFTTNYDILFERSMEREHTPFFDGFVGSYRPYFSPDAIEIESIVPGRAWTRIWKLHGSVNWSLVAGQATRLSTTGCSDMVLPSQRKYDESRKMPYLALMDRLTKALSADGTLLVTCGYSWNDQHVNSTILTALDNGTRSAVIALSYAELDAQPHLVTLAEARNNLLVIAPREGILHGDRRPWALPHAISKATASFLDISFDSDAIPDLDDTPITGQMRLGDFSTFCAFLATMGSEDKP